MAEGALGARPGALLVRIQGSERPNGAIGPGINSTAWGILALRQARERAPQPAVRYLIRHQARSGGFAWNPGGQPDSNDTAAAVEALRAAGVKGSPIRRALAYLRPAAQPRRRLRADPRPRLGRAVDRLGDPGVRGRAPQGAGRLARVSQATAPHRRQLPLLEALRDDAGLGHGAGAARAHRRPFPLVATQPGSGARAGPPQPALRPGRQVAARRTTGAARPRARRPPRALRRPRRPRARRRAAPARPGPSARAGSCAGAAPRRRCCGRRRRRSARAGSARFSSFGFSPSSSCRSSSSEGPASARCRSSGSSPSRSSSARQTGSSSRDLGGDEQALPAVDAEHE